MGERVSALIFLAFAGHMVESFIFAGQLRFQLDVSQKLAATKHRDDIQRRYLEPLFSIRVEEHLKIEFAAVQTLRRFVFSVADQVKNEYVFISKLKPCNFPQRHKNRRIMC